MLDQKKTLGDYYDQERSFLLLAGAEFARRYKKIASRLLLEPGGSADPHVERLIEAVAFLAGRIQLKLDDEFPELTESLLNVLYPHYLAPVPSLTIARFALDARPSQLTGGYILPRHTPLLTALINGAPCRFRTCYPVTVWPVEIEAARVESRGPADSRGRWSEAVLRLTLRCHGNATLSGLATTEASAGGSPRQHGRAAGPLDSLRFCINGDSQLAYQLYEMIFNHATRVEVRGAGATVQQQPQPLVSLGVDAIREVGFRADESLLPPSARGFAGYRLLSEYFAFPEKFLFFDVAGLGEAARQARFGMRFDILVHLRDVPSPKRAADLRDLFHLGCTPAVNLFKDSVGVDLTQRKYEYHLLMDVYRPRGVEVYSVDEVAADGAGGAGARAYHPFYSYRRADNPDGEQVFWYATRRPSQAEQDDGTEVYLSLVDPDFDPRLPSEGSLTVRATCTNRDLPAKLPSAGPDALFHVEGAGPLSRAAYLMKPTTAVRPPLRRAAQWHLISHLSLNHLSIVAADGEGEGKGRPRALQQILTLYDYLNTAATKKQIEGLVRIDSRPVTRQVGHHVGAGFVRGIETTIEFDEESFIGSGLYLFASVLERFLGLYASINSFTQLVATVKQRGEMKRWKPRAGEQPLL